MWVCQGTTCYFLAINTASRFWLEFRGPIYISVSSQPHGIYYKKYTESARARLFRRLAYDNLFIRARIPLRYGLFYNLQHANCYMYLFGSQNKGI